MANPCGKNCGECTVREEIRCGGCAAVVSETGCEIADCVSQKNHESCDTCTMRPTCPTRRHAASMHIQRQKAEEEKQEKQRRLAKNAGLLVKWLYPVFWITILQIPLSFAEELTDIAGAKLIEDLILAASNFAVAFCLWKMQAAEKRYRTAALFHGSAALLNALRIIIFGFLFYRFAKLSLIFTLPAAVLMLAGVYHTFIAHSWMTAEADWVLSDNWERLWKWEIIALVGTLSSPILAFFGTIGLLAVFAVLIFGVVVDILALVYLWRTAELMKAYAEE